MAWLDDFLGNSQRRDVRSATADANQYLLSGRDAALDELGLGRTSQLAALTGGYDAALAGLTGAGTQGRADITAGYDTARGDIGAGYDRAVGTAEDYLTRTSNILDPYITRGRGADDIYDRFMGLRGEDERQAAIDQYRVTNPLFSEVDDRANEELMRAMNARGITGGRANLTVARAGMERGEDRLRQYMDRLDSLSNRGQQAAGQVAQYTDQTGRTIGGYQVGQGTALGQLEMNRGQALASHGTQNAGQIADLQAGRGNAVAGVEGGYAGNRAGLIHGTNQQLGANRINLGNATAAARTAGINNILALGGTAVRAATPGLGGTSAAGNIMAGAKSLFR